MKYALFIVLGLLVAGGVIYYLVTMTGSPVVVEDDQDTIVVVDDEPAEQDPSDDPLDTEAERGSETVLGTTVEGRAITAHHYGSGDRELLFVGGIHGGYEWNTVLVAYELMDYLESNPERIPENVSVTVIPVLNPDGLTKIVGTDGRFNPSLIPTGEGATIPGRFNANNVDLNRNFDCEWQAEGTWQSRTVSGGSAPFSEPESQAFRDYIAAYPPDAAVAWYSAAGGVFASSCHNGVSAETRVLTNLYADAADYEAYESFDFYEITGDMVNWLAGEGIPAISVLLTTHEDIEWEKNERGIEAMLTHYSQ